MYDPYLLVLLKDHIHINLCSKKTLIYMYVCIMSCNVFFFSGTCRTADVGDPLQDFTLGDERAMEEISSKSV